MSSFTGYSVAKHILPAASLTEHNELVPVFTNAEVISRRTQLPTIFTLGLALRADAHSQIILC